MSDSRSDRSAKRESRLAEYPPSAKYVYSVLEYEGRSTPHELRATTLMPQRTVSHALTTLENAGLVEKRVRRSDARVREYIVADDE